MKWLKKLFCKLFGCKCGCQESKPCVCNIDLSKIKNDEFFINDKKVKITTKSKVAKETKATSKTTKKKVTKKTNKKAKK